MWRISLLLMLSLVLLSTAAYGQETASIVGTVTDPSGAAVPSAKVTITNTDTGLVRPTTTNATGSYAAHELCIRALQGPGGGAGFKPYRTDRHHAQRE